MTESSIQLETMLKTALDAVPDPSKGLPDEVFHFIRKVTPLTNVDLLVRNEKGEHLLAWREDEYARGWHIPGGIIRFKESLAQRIAAVAKLELSATVEHSPTPIELREIFSPRGHFISLLYLCRLSSPVTEIPFWNGNDRPQHGQLHWCLGIPTELYRAHKAFADWLSGKKA